MSLTQLIAEYGYFAIFVGCMLEGETILILCGFAAYQGYLSLPLVVLVATFGGALGDYIFFFLGRYYGSALLVKFPSLQARAEVVNQRIMHYHMILIIGVRFMYGLRIAGPIAIGMSKVSIWRFLILNLLGAFLWAILIGGAGYVFGQALQKFFVDLKKYEEIALWLVVLMLLLVTGIHCLRNRRKYQKTDYHKKP